MSRSLVSISLTPQLQEYIQLRVHRTGYLSVSEYIRELIRIDQRSWRDRDVGESPQPSEQLRFKDTEDVRAPRW